MLSAQDTRRPRQIGLQFDGGHAPVLPQGERRPQRRAEGQGRQGGQQHACAQAEFRRGLRRGGRVRKSDVFGHVSAIGPRSRDPVGPRQRKQCVGGRQGPRRVPRIAD